MVSDNAGSTMGPASPAGRFEPGFLLGAATAAHQVEGNNTNSDDWALEQMPHGGFNEPSGDADDEWNRYKEDIDLLAGAGLNAYRFSIEWARIEPEEGKFDQAALRHYVDEIDYCRSKGVEPVVTLLHFTSPVWLIREGGWKSPETPARFARYVRFVMSAIGDRVRYVCTINEANMGLQVAELIERYKKQAAAAAASAGAKGASDASVQMGINLQKMAEAQKIAAQEKAAVFGTPDPATFTSNLGEQGDKIIMEAHRQAVKVIREVSPDVKVGLTLSLHHVVAVDGGESQAAKMWDDEFRHYLPVIADDDFLGVQNYTSAELGADGQLPVPKGVEKTKSGYAFDPEALAGVIRKVAEDFHGDLIVTENGCDTDDDTRRAEFIRRALAGVRGCIDDGLPVRGYFHWSLLDNFEWQKGYYDTFGLIAVDRPSQARHPKPSLRVLGSYAPARARR